MYRPCLPRPKTLPWLSALAHRAPAALAYYGPLLLPSQQERKERRHKHELTIQLHVHAYMYIYMYMYVLYVCTIMRVQYVICIYTCRILIHTVHVHVHVAEHDVYQVLASALEVPELPPVRKKYDKTAM